MVLYYCGIQRLSYPASVGLSGVLEIPEDVAGDANIRLVAFCSEAV
jgi:hypothetical protein